MVVAHHDLLILLNGTALNAADGNAAHELIVVDRGDKHLERRLWIALGGRDIVDDGIEQGNQIGAQFIGGVGGDALTAGAE